MRFESVKGSYDGYEYDMSDNRYKPVKNKKKIGLALLIVAIVALSIFLIKRQPSAPVWFKPAVGASYYHQATGTIDMEQNVDIYSVPLFSGDVIKNLQSKGKKVVCQYSVGLWKQGQPELDSKYLGKLLQNNGYAMDIRQDAVKDYVSQFIQKASQFGCDGFEPLDMNVYSSDNDLDIGLDDQLRFSKWIATTSHSFNLFTGMVNAVLQLSVSNEFDYVLAIDCFMTNNCGSYQQVISNNKPVFEMETSLDTNMFCDKANSLQFYSFKKSADFGPGAEYCRK